MWPQLVNGWEAGLLRSVPLWVGCWEASYSGPSLCLAHPHGGWSGPASVVTVVFQEYEGGSRKTSWSLDLEVSHHHFCHILLVEVVTKNPVLIQGWENRLLGWNCNESVGYRQVAQGLQLWPPIKLGLWGLFLLGSEFWPWERNGTVNSVSLPSDQHLTIQFLLSGHDFSLRFLS